MTEFTTYDYVVGGDPRQQLDVFSPVPANDLRTAVLVFHGGAFRHGDRSAVHERCRALAARGFTGIAVGYRLLDVAAWPAPLDDAKAALAWVREHADELGVEAGRIALQGHSAGAQLSLLVAGQVPAGEVGAVAAYFPPAATAVRPSPGDMPAGMIFGPETTDELAASASPINNIGLAFPPTVLVHGASDRFIPPVAALRLFEAITAGGSIAELHLIAGGDHEFDMTPRYTESLTAAVTEFLRAQLVEPELVAKEVIDSNPFASMPPPGA